MTTPVECRIGYDSNRERVAELVDAPTQEVSRVLQFALDIIKEGHRVLAVKYHPDKGGKTEDI